MGLMKVTASPTRRTAFLIRLVLIAQASELTTTKANN
jgi:hypothetical protein